MSENFTRELTKMFYLIELSVLPEMLTILPSFLERIKVSYLIVVS